MQERTRTDYDNLPIKDKIGVCLERLKGFPQIKVLVDGLARSGKGTLATKIGEGLNLKRIGTGDMYRVITYYFLQRDLRAVDTQVLDDQALKKILDDLKIDLDFTNMTWSANGLALQQQELRSKEVDQGVSIIAGRSVVRDVVDNYQYQLLQETDRIFLEGRDMWEVFQDCRNMPGVFIIYLFASAEELAKREITAQAAMGRVINEEEAKERVINRNLADNGHERGRLWLPEQVAEGKGDYDLAIDTTSLSPDEVYLRVLETLCDALPVKHRGAEHCRQVAELIVEDTIAAISDLSELQTILQQLTKTGGVELAQAVINKYFAFTKDQKCDPRIVEITRQLDFSAEELRTALINLLNQHLEA